MVDASIVEMLGAAVAGAALPLVALVGQEGSQSADELAECVTNLTARLSAAEATVSRFELELTAARKRADTAEQARAGAVEATEKVRTELSAKLLRAEERASTAEGQVSKLREHLDEMREALAERDAEVDQLSKKTRQRETGASTQGTGRAGAGKLEEALAEARSARRAEAAAADRAAALDEAYRKSQLEAEDALSEAEAAKEELAARQEQLMRLLAQAADKLQAQGGSAAAVGKDLATALSAKPASSAPARPVTPPAPPTPTAAKKANTPLPPPPSAPPPPVPPPPATATKAEPAKLPKTAARGPAPGGGARPGKQPAPSVVDPQEVARLQALSPVTTAAQVDALKTVAEVRDQLRRLKFAQGRDDVQLGSKMKSAELRTYLKKVLGVS